ncbi:Uncharacterized membrane protein [Paenibacillus algorifonticola]|uniref:Uncharacterized membrane protein n=1 Tax=Paenibacillus algorifonticola TaxID=684063 RepID=A0A1I2DQR1_9BACL|nr:DUF4870 domain-containing protein [Paenibacillus algorifonticola]SFE82643.1 Uncharacterized membrane protein [Paenibacillus algorifonticola]
MQQFNQPDQSSTGLDPKVAALLCYVLSFVSGIIFLVLEKNSRFVKFHAMQSIITFGGLFVVMMVLNIIPIIGTLISGLLGVLGFVLWIVLMLQAYQGKQFKLPYVGDIAEKQAAQFK